MAPNFSLADSRGNFQRRVALRKKLDRNWIRNSQGGLGQFSSPRRRRRRFPFGATSKIAPPTKIKLPGKNNKGVSASSYGKGNAI